MGYRSSPLVQIVTVKLAVIVMSGFFCSDAYGRNAADVAVEAAKQYSGSEITILWEAGLQALDPLKFSGPKWTELTGIEVKVVEAPTAEMFTRIYEEHRAGTGAFDAVNVIPAWLPDLAIAGALEPLDSYIEKYGYRDELSDIAAVYRGNHMTFDDTIYGFPDDGDVFLLYYRKDIFEKNGLEPPSTWAEFSKVGQKLTDIYAPEMYGAGIFGSPTHVLYIFQQRFRTAGGEFFNPETMAATINSEAGVQVFTEFLEEGKFMPPGIHQSGFIDNLSSFLSGDIAMTISWPPYGRWAAGYGSGEEALAWVPKSTIAGKVGYAIPPGGHPQLAAGYSLSVSASSKNKEAAYLFIQWLNSKEISLQRVQLPYALRDPFRDSHFASEEYKQRWPDAALYLDRLRVGAESGLQDLSILLTDSYDEALRQGIAKLWTGVDPKVILDEVAANWDLITNRVGIEKQKIVYRRWAKKPNAYPRQESNQVNLAID